jgi:hypothetical protein
MLFSRFLYNIHITEWHDSKHSLLNQYLWKKKKKKKNKKKKKKKKYWSNGCF